MPTESERQRDTRIRLTVFAWLEEQTQIHGDVLPWSSLARDVYILVGSSSSGGRPMLGDE